MLSGSERWWTTRGGGTLRDENGNTGTDGGAPLAGRRVVVTGAGSGIGRAIALAAARSGADVALTYRANARGAAETAAAIEALGRRAPRFALDLADEGAIAAFARDAAAALGGVDAWFNNAGADVLTGAGGSLGMVEKLDLLIAVDLRGTMLASWRAAELMAAQPEGGVIVNMSWDHVLTGMAGRNQQLFAAVKGGVLSFSKALARTVAPRVRVNILAPGWIETAFGATADERWRQGVADSTPLKRWGTPEDVAGAAVFLASPAAGFLTGQTLLVGGGVVM
jgi:3-oxoacyl-[acyl-carrier protein] reductase